MSRAKKEMVSDDYYDLSEEETQDLIDSAQAGDGAAMQELTNMFSNFLTKYHSLLWHTRYPLGHYDIRRFIALFVKNNQARGFLLRNKLNKATRTHIHETVRGITWMIERYASDEEVWQTVYVTFYDCVDRYERRYNDDGSLIPFSGYLYNYFYFLMKKNVEVMLIDQLGRKTFPLWTEEHTEEGEAHVGYTAPVPEFDEEAMFLAADVIDDSWVIGDTAYPPFDALTTQERQLIRWRYEDRKRFADISEITTESHESIRDDFARIRMKLRDTIRLDDEIARR